MTNRFGSGCFSHDCLPCCTAASALAYMSRAQMHQGNEEIRAEIARAIPVMGAAALYIRAIAQVVKTLSAWSHEKPLYRTAIQCHYAESGCCIATREKR